jgi:hypothetical protein
MGFGALYLLACHAALVELFRLCSPKSTASVNSNDEAFLGTYLVAMAIIAWVTVLTGAYVIYPGIAPLRRQEHSISAPIHKPFSN